MGGRAISRNRRVRRAVGRWFALGLALTVFTTAPAFASNQTNAAVSPARLKKLSLEELMEVEIPVVFGASRHEQKITDAPANVTILTAEDIKFHGWRTLGEALRSVSGIVVISDRAYSYIGVRGFNRPGDFSGRVLVTVDGHRLNDAMYDTSAMDTDFLLDLDLIEKIEVIRGPGSTLYGNNAFFGVINIITRKGRDVHGAEASVSAGSFDTYTGRFTVGNHFTNGVEVLLSGSYYDSEGHDRLRYPEFASVNNGNADHLDGGHAPRLFGSLSWKGLEFTAGYTDRFKREPTAQFSSDNALVVFNDRRFRTADERAFADLKFTRTFENEWTLTTRAYYDHYRYAGWYPYNYEPTNPAAPTTINYDMDRTESFGGEVLLNRRCFGKHWLTLGAEARYDYQLRLFNEDLDPRATYFDLNKSGYFAGAFVQDEFQMWNNLSLQAGVRYDYFRSVGGTVNPRAALIYHPWEPSTLKLLYGRAYRAPNAYENYYNWPLPTGTSPPGPETIHTYEVVYEHRFNPVWNAKASLFFNELVNTITGNGNDGFVNTTDAVTKGLEAEVAARWPGGVRGRASYTYADARNEATHERMANSPEHLAKLNLAVPLWREKIFAAAEIQAMSRRLTINGGSVNGFWIANFTLFSQELAPGLEISAGVYNLFDQRYQDPVSPDFTQGAIEQDGRTFRVKLTYRF